MTEIKYKTLDELLHKDSKKIGDVKRMIERYGIYSYTRWEEWEAAPKGKGSSEQAIKNAISALGEYADIRSEGSQQSLDDYYRNPDNQAICRYGFRVENNNKLFVENTALQNQEELIEQLQSELASAKIEIDNLREQPNKINKLPDNSPDVTHECGDPRQGEGSPPSDFTSYPLAIRATISAFKEFWVKFGDSPTLEPKQSKPNSADITKWIMQNYQEIGKTQAGRIDRIIRPDWAKMGGKPLSKP
jgi:hypothetical protein